MQFWRVILPALAAGVALLLISVWIVGRDVRAARQDTESDVIGLSEASAQAVGFAPAGEIGPYLSGLVRHPAIEMATVYASDGSRTTRKRPSGAEPLFGKWFARLHGDPVIGCKAVGSSSICLQADMTYFDRRLAALVVPHAILLAASALLLLAAVILGRGSSAKDVVRITNVLETAADENNYALRATADSGAAAGLAVAVNKLLEQMHQRDLTLRRRSTELESVNQELEAFSYAVSHDLRNPIASMRGFTEALREDYADRLDDDGRECLHWLETSVEQMANLVEGLLQMSRASRTEINRTRVDLSEVAQSVADSLRTRNGSRDVDFRIEPGLVVSGDERLLHAVLENLMSNAYKFTSKREKAVIAIGSTTIEGGRRAYFVKDNGAGFDTTQAARMFTPFQRLHSSSDFEGTGIGLSTVKRIIERHGGTIWADGQVGEGATFSFTLADGPVV